ncbi:MAG TPA: hypothetical protein VKZ82_07460 [Nonomuraea sp.]|uniref:hypothetical protein n=1 Tax=Nonomuraea sp. NPDC049649 TaxID=3155776 RepID=UPI002BCDE455|nr:hypothetical protein [Nonomuraea sp.]
MSDRRPSRRLREQADVLFTATVRADRLRFAEAPETEVRFDGEPGEESGSGSRRERLPDRVTAGEEYRKVTIEYVIASRIALSGEEG